MIRKRYASNKRPWDTTNKLVLRDGGLVVPLGRSADFSDAELSHLTPYYEMEDSDDPPVEETFPSTFNEVRVEGRVEIEQDDLPRILDFSDIERWEELSGRVIAPITTRMRGIWEPGKDYSVGDVVLVSGAIWQAVTAHTSGAEFDPDDWTQNTSASGTEAFYLEYTTAIVTATSGDTPKDIPGLQITIGPTISPMMLRARTDQLLITTPGDIGYISIVNITDGTNRSKFSKAAISFDTDEATVLWRLPPLDSPKTFKVQIGTLDSDTAITASENTPTFFEGIWR